MKKIILALCLFSTVALTFTSCSDDDDDNTTPEYVEGAIAYTAGAGNWNQNNGTVGAITLNSLGEYGYSDIYQQQNGRGIGDAQDILLFNGHIYVTSTTSSKIEILDHNGKVEKSIPMPNKSPRYLATDSRYVYASAYSGYVYKLDANGIIDSVQVGDHPEAMSVVNRQLFVNISGYGSGSTVAVVNLSSFRKTQDVACALDPYNQSVSDGRYVYFISCLDNKQPNVVQRIDSRASTFTADSIFNASTIAYSQSTNSLVALNTYYDASWTTHFDGFFSYNLTTGVRTNFDSSALTSPSQVNVDPTTGNIYVIDNPSYSTPSVVFIYDKNGTLLTPNGIQMGYSVQNIRFGNM